MVRNCSCDRRERFWSFGFTSSAGTAERERSREEIQWGSQTPIEMLINGYSVYRRKIRRMWMRASGLCFTLVVILEQVKVMSWFKLGWYYVLLCMSVNPENSIASLRWGFCWASRAWTSEIHQWEQKIVGKPSRWDQWSSTWSSATCCQSIFHMFLGHRHSLGQISRHQMQLLLLRKKKMPLGLG